MPQTPRTHTKAMIVIAAALFVAWVFLHPDLPWWASALMLAGVAVISLHAVVIARGERDE